MNDNNDKFGELFQKTVSFIGAFIDETSFFSIDKLKELDPNIDEIATIVRQIGDFLKTIASEPFYDANKATNIFQCSLIMERMAIAVKDENLKEFQTLSKELEKHAK
ncbi:hypothetical protein SPONN_2480 [uncultured Candidatus Thioglobus sp.]|nr:hypothetical protein SPONN_2480 [uncultured Candidatus Thioglobus sp.]